MFETVNGHNIDDAMTRLQQIDELMQKRKSSGDTSNFNQIIQLHNEGIALAEKINNFLESVLDEH